MKAIPWEDSLSKQEQSLLVGGLLGDARLESRSKAGTARLRIHHAESQKEYVFWKYRLLQSRVAGPPWKTAWIDRRNGETYVSWFFHTRTLTQFTPFWKLFYPRGKKQLPETIWSYLDPMALAVWFMDDGCFQEDCIILNTQSFTREEHVSLQRYFLQRYGIATGIQRDRRNVRLRFGRNQKERIMEIIQPFLLPLFCKTIPVTTDSRIIRDEIVITR